MAIDYTTMSNRKLSALVRQARRADRLPPCEKGHDGCGCTRVMTYRSAPCLVAVEAEIARRTMGNPVLVQRGGSPRPGVPGCKRVVRGTLIKWGEVDCYVRLDEDDPLSTISEWSHKGDIGHWSPSCVALDLARLGSATPIETPKKRRTRICPWCAQRVEVERGANVEHTKGKKRCEGSGMAPVPRGHE
jgi:hypothetical protein